MAKSTATQTIMLCGWLTISETKATSYYCRADGLLDDEITE
jgi:hypothetical protein